ncbi:MAG: hypothetical protein MR372_08300 [Lachnospiraceae bacterium]|nr:hypothetical protein [Lachnospiraceae bacterium]
MPTQKQMANLKPMNKRSKSERREIGSKGGKARAKKQRERKTFQETARLILGMAVKSGEAVDISTIQSFADLNGKNMSVEEAIVLAQALRAIKGDRYAAEYLRDTAGEKPVEKVQVKPNIKEVTQRIEEIFAEERENET